MKVTKKSLSMGSILLICISALIIVWYMNANKSNASDVSRTFDGTKEMYFNLGNCGDSWWNNSGCVHRAYFFGKDTLWVTLNSTGEDGLYSCVVTGTFSNVILCRCKSSSSDWSSGIYNQTGDIALDMTSDYISYFGGEGKTDVTWATYNSSTIQTVEPTTSAVEPTIKPTAATSNTENYTKLASTTSEGTILHAFNWSYDVIRANLKSIAAAGYTTVQTSPVQQPKDYMPTYTKVSDQWWKLYQPLSFSIAKDSWLGSTSELTALCNEAHKYNIKIICDIVANHMANGTSDGDVNANIANYESAIYNDRNLYFHNFFYADDNGISNVVQGSIGMPDLNTSNEYIQSRVISLLKECIDCGVDGFRFDAAKHIETPSDGSYASNFWPNVVSSARTYADSKGKNLYIYGEILSPCGTSRSFSAYTKYINVTDNKTGDNALYGIYSGNVSQAGSYYYQSGITADKLVLWAESHDTYMGSSGSMGLTNTSGVNTVMINKAWAIVASRASSTPLYFARPGLSMCTCGSDEFKSSEVSAVNFFHNKYSAAKEYISTSGQCVLVERYYQSKGADGGAVITNVTGTSQSVSLTTNVLADGSYKDRITGNIFTVTNGVISGSIGSSGIAVIY